MVKVLNTRKLTEASMLSALFVVTSMMAIYTGIAYTLYLDMIVPLFICLIYMRLGMKYTLLSSITSLLIVILAIGDVPSAIWMSQGIIMGLVCGYFIVKRSTIFDDLLCSSVLGCFVMILIDIYFSKLTGYSFIKEFNEYKEMFSLNEGMFNIALNIFIATIPVSTVLVVYIGALLIAKKLGILNKYNTEKYLIVKNFKRVGSFICCSKNTFTFSILYLIFIEIFKIINVDINLVYLRTVLMSVRVVVIYFVLKDSLNFITKGISLMTKSKGIVQLVWLFSIYMLLVNFKITLMVLITVGLIINYMLNLRTRQSTILNTFLVKKAIQ